MKHISLANKYRPATFEEVVGQRFTIQILQNQVSTGTFKQGYLFCGGAGTGKTSVARIFARELKAEMIEIDAASNNGVDNVREIRDSCHHKPISHEYKAYIIDEVHMLSTGAFNALLKTLEEPPAHAVFILCTTDPQKIPATILSRVQRFDFKRLTSEQVLGRLKDILKQEGISKAVDDEALEYITKLAQGGMRNAISILDTCLSYGKTLTQDSVSDILGLSSFELLLDLYDALPGDKDKVVSIIEGQHEQGKDLRVFLKQFIELLVELMKYDLTGTEYLNIPSMYFDRLKEVKMDRDRLGQWFLALNELSNSIRFEPGPKSLIMGVLLCLK